MIDEEKLQTAKDIVPKLLAASNITKVVSIDDYYASGPVLEDVLAAQGKIPEHVLLKLFPEMGAVPDDLQVRTQRFQRAYEILTEERSRDVGEKILLEAYELTGQDQIDTLYVSTLQDLFDDEMLETLSPMEWDRLSETILNDDTQGKILLLFDQDLSNGGGLSKGGMAYISGLLAGTNRDKVMCGLLTHTVNTDEQQTEWESLSKEFDIDKDKFIVVAKCWLNPNPLFFTNMLKMVIQSPGFSAMKTKVKEILTSATESAAKNIDRISIFDFDHIVFKVPYEEGMWEPEMLFRLHALYQRAEARRLAYQDPDFKNLANELRKVSLIPTEKGFLPPSDAWSIQRMELYETPEQINQLHLPLELGDIFKREEGGAKDFFILLAQPCDLAIRSDGARAPEHEHVPLLRISIDDGEKKYVSPLPYFSKEPGKQYVIKLKRPRYVKTQILDLCSYNQNGEAIIQIGAQGDDSLPPNLLNRCALINDYYKKEMNKYKVLFPQEGDKQRMINRRNEFLKQLGPHLLQDTLFRANIVVGEPFTISFNCTRIGRLCGKEAYALLMAFTACLSRAALDRDFGNLN